jgi:uncharacterized protein (TIGR02147 family)
MPQLFHYIDYRSYLKDYYREKKASAKSFSYRYFSQKAGISSPVFLKLVMEGKRNLGRDGTEKFIKALEFNEKESRYFRKLVLFNQATHSSEKQEHYESIRELSGAVSESALNRSEYKYYSLWYLPVLRELVTLGAFQDFEQLGKSLRPEITAGEARQGIELLQELGMIKRRKDGSYAQKNAAITSGPDLQRMALLEFHSSMLELSKDALFQLKKEERHISAMTLGVSQSAYDAILVEYEAFRERVLKLVHGDTYSDRVVHMGFQLLPMAKYPGQNTKGGEDE